jgi:AcrR family transcriptional regulator
MTERADAAHNRRAILDAASRLLSEREPGSISLDVVALAAGVGKGTVFRRFGNRQGLFEALLAERAEAIAVAIEHGPPPLGPGAAPAERLLAFLNELSGLATENVSLMSAYQQACADDRFRDPTYRRWHAHITDLTAQLRPETDTTYLAHILLGCFDANLVQHVLSTSGPSGLHDRVRDVTTALVPNRPK